MSWKKSSSDCGDSVSTCGVRPSGRLIRAAASTTASASTAQTRQAAWVKMRSGANSASESSSNSNSGPPPASFTCWSISPLERAASSFGRVRTGRSPTSAGKSHSCDRPTSNPLAPMAATISVAAGKSEAIRIGRTATFFNISATSCRGPFAKGNLRLVSSHSQKYF